MKIAWFIIMFILATGFLGEQTKAAQMTNHIIEQSGTAESASQTPDQLKLNTANYRLNFWNRLYLIFGVIALTSTSVTLASSYFIYKNSKTITGLEDSISDKKDHDLREYQAAANVKIAEADAQAQQAKRDAADAAVRVAVANEKIAQLNLADAELKAENLKLEAAIAPRRLGPVDPKILQHFSDVAAPKFPKRIVLTSYILDQESAILSSQILAVLIRAGGGVQYEAGTQMPDRSTLSGVIVYGTDTILVKAILDLLRSGGIPCLPAMNLVDGPTRLQSFVPGETQGYATVPANGPMAPAVVFVGLKPPPTQ